MKAMSSSYGCHQVGFDLAQQPGGKGAPRYALRGFARPQHVRRHCDLGALPQRRQTHLDAASHQRTHHGPGRSRIITGLHHLDHGRRERVNDQQAPDSALQDVAHPAAAAGTTRPGSQ